MKPLHPSARGRVPGLGARLVSLAGIVVTGLLLALWRIATYGGLVRTDFLPPPHAVIAATARGGGRAHARIPHHQGADPLPA